MGLWAVNGQSGIPFIGKHINWRHLPVVMVCDVVCIESKCNGGVSEEWESCKMIS